MIKLFLFLFGSLLIFSYHSENDLVNVVFLDVKYEKKIELNKRGIPQYVVLENNYLVVEKSTLAFDTAKIDDFKDDFSMSDLSSSKDEYREMPWGKNRMVKNEYNAMQIDFINASHKKLTLHFGAYDDGIAFRLEFPTQENLDDLLIDKKNSEFQFTGNHTACWIPSNWDTMNTYIILQKLRNA